MLNAVALKGFGAPIVHVYWQRYGDSALRIRRPLAVVLVDVQIIRDDAKLLASHLENLVIVNRYGGICRNLGLHRKVAICAVVVMPSNPKRRCNEIGRASCRERVLIWVEDGSAN